MEAVRAGGDLRKVGGDEKYAKTVVCPDGCVIFRLTATPTGKRNFFEGKFYESKDKNGESGRTSGRPASGVWALINDGLLSLFQAMAVS